MTKAYKNEGACNATSHFVQQAAVDARRAAESRIDCAAAWGEFASKLPTMRKSEREWLCDHFARCYGIVGMKEGETY